MKYSIVIPTYNHCDDLLKPCVEAILNYTNMSEVELVISANGCRDNTKEYLEQLKQTFNNFGHGDHLKTVWHDEALGYSRATNEGIKIATGEYIILFNNDAFLLPQERHRWIRQLSHPFQDNPKCGITCLIKGPSEPAGHHFAIFFLVMIHRRVFDTIGLLNEEYGVGGGEDTEFCIEAERAGFEVCECVPKNWSKDVNLYVGDFPVWHQGEGTVHDPNLVPDWSNIFFLNSLKLAKKYNRPWFEAHTKELPLDHARLKAQDPFIYNEIFESNYYKILPEEIQDRVVIDIGANVGMFSLRCHELGAKEIYAVEAQPTIFKKLLKEYTLPYETIRPLNFAVHSDFGQIVHIPNQGGLSKISDTGEPVTTITLEKLLVDNRIQNNNLVLKLDCEGSEFDILLFSRSDVIQRFDIIYMELHANTNQNSAFHDPNLVRFYLSNAGFRCVHQLHLFGQDPVTGELNIPMNTFLEKWTKQ